MNYSYFIYGNGGNRYWFRYLVELHRGDGPAIEYLFGDTIVGQYYLFGKQVSRLEFEKVTKRGLLK